MEWCERLKLGRAGRSSNRVESWGGSWPTGYLAARLAGPCFYNKRVGMLVLVS